MNPTLEVLKSEIKKLRFLLIALTVLQLGYLMLSFYNPQLHMHLVFNYYANWIIGILHWIVAGVFIWYNWNRWPVDRKKKKNNTWMILFVGIIGMWLWLPTKNELDRLKQ